MNGIQLSNKATGAAPSKKLKSQAVRYQKVAAAALFCLTLLLAVTAHEAAWTSLKKGHSTKIPKKPEGSTHVVSFDIHSRFQIKGNVTKLWYISCIPKTIQDRQGVIDIRFSPEPIAIYDDDDTRYAVFSFRSPRGNLDVNITGEIELYRYDLETAISVRTRAKAARPITLSDEERSRFLRGERFLEVDDPAVRKAADGLRGPRKHLQTNPQSHGADALQKAEVDAIQEILDWMRQRLQYEEHTDRLRGAGRAITLGKGKCSDFSNVFVTLCRAKGLPAKVVKGLNTYFENDPTHQWAEVFISGLGWVPFDPTWMSSAYARLRPIYINQTYMSTDGRLHLDTGSGTSRWWWKTGKAEVDTTHSYHFYDRGPGGS